MSVTIASAAPSVTPTGAPPETPPAAEEPERWPRLDRHITLALVFAVILETAGGLVWVGALGARVQQMETQFSERAEEIRRLAHLEAEVGAMRDQLDRIEGRLDSLVEHRRDGGAL